VDLVELSEAIASQNYRHDQILSNGDRIVIYFPDTQDARQFAGSLLSCGIPRQFQNNKVDAKVSFPETFVDRVLELLRWT
jgi:hypothetical protein